MRSQRSILTTVQQPFACGTCQARLTRQENLKRHEALHETDVRLACEICGISCSRRDLLNRHLKRKHPELSQSLPSTSPVNRIRHHSSVSVQTQDDDWQDDSDSIGPSSFGTSHSLAFSFDNLSPSLSRGTIPREDESETHDLFFDHVSEWLPFIHRATFDSDAAPEHLILAMACLGLAASNQDATLALDCYREAAMLVEDAKYNDLTDALHLAQCFLLLEVYTILYASESLSAAGLRHHSRLIALIRSSGLLRAEQTTASDLEAVWRGFLFSESCKRTVLAIHQLDAMWYLLLSIPRSLSHLEIKYEMPVEEWTAETSSDWAFRRLTGTEKPITYAEAIRLCTSGMTKELNPFGMINVVHFVLSSIREVSGWSTMTNQVSLDRIEPLRTALTALQPHNHSVPLEAIWRIAMVELHIWSLPHTGGVVHSSIESALLYSTGLAAAGNLIFSVEIMDTIRPHVEWFLRWLDNGEDGPPWVLLFAYQVFLWTWQCLRQGLPSVFDIVVNDGSALAWARTSFARRHGKTAETILRCLDILGDTGD